MGNYRVVRGAAIGISVPAAWATSQMKEQNDAETLKGADGNMVRTMELGDYEKVYNLWAHTAGMGLNTTDDSKEGIAKYLARNPNTCFVSED